MGDRRPDDHVN